MAAPPPRGTRRGFIPAALMPVYLWIIVALALVAILAPAALDGRKRRADVAAFTASLTDLATKQDAWRARHGTYGSQGVVAWRPASAAWWLGASEGAYDAWLASPHVLRPRVICVVSARDGVNAPVTCRGWRLWLIPRTERTS